MYMDCMCGDLCMYVGGSSVYLYIISLPTNMGSGCMSGCMSVCVCGVWYVGERSSMYLRSDMCGWISMYVGSGVYIYGWV